MKLTAVTSRRYKIFGIDDLIFGGLTLAGGLANNLFASEKQEDAQQFNAEQAAIAREFNAAEAGKNRDWSHAEAAINRDYQTTMANSAYQRGMADMKKAGLNPILAYSRGGASAPAGNMPSGSAASGSAASAPTPSTSSLGIGESAASAIAFQRQKAEIDNIKTQNNAIHAQTARDLSAANVNSAQTLNIEANTRIASENLSGAQKAAVEAKLAKQNLDNPLGAATYRAGHAAEMGSRVVAPVFDLLNSGKRIAAPFRNYPTRSTTETTHSSGGSTFQERFNY